MRKELPSVIITKDLGVYYRGDYNFIVEDLDRTYNINSHSYSCFAFSLEEAIGHLYINRPEFRTRRIQSVTCDGEILNVDFYGKQKNR